MAPNREHHSSETHKKWAPLTKEVVSTVDLEKELQSRGLEVLSHGRINWATASAKDRFEYADDSDAGKIITVLIKDRKIKGEVVAIWSNTNLRAITFDSSEIEKIAQSICEEDWDLWLMQENTEWVIEKYHEGEIVFHSSP